MSKLQPCIIRVWTSEENKEFPGHSVGHISVETIADPENPRESGFYMSLWPVPFTEEDIARFQAANSLKQKYLKYFMPRKADFHQDLNADIDAEKEDDKGYDGRPQVTVCLYTLDVHAMNNKFSQLANSTQHWRLIGSNQLVENLKTQPPCAGGACANPRNPKDFKTFGKSQPPKENCASLVLKVLKAGGISKLVNLSAYSTFTTKTSTIVKPDEIINVLMPARLRELQNPKIAARSFEGETEAPEPKGCVIL